MNDKKTDNKDDSEKFAKSQETAALKELQKREEELLLILTTTCI